MGSTSSRVEASGDFIQTDSKEIDLAKLHQCRMPDCIQKDPPTVSDIDPQRAVIVKNQKIVLNTMAESDIDSVGLSTISKETHSRLLLEGHIKENCEVYYYMYPDRDIPSIDMNDVSIHDKKIQSTEVFFPDNTLMVYSYKMLYAVYNNITGKYYGRF